MDAYGRKRTLAIPNFGALLVSAFRPKADVPKGLMPPLANVRYRPKADIRFGAALVPAIDRKNRGRTAVS